HRALLPPLGGRRAPVHLRARAPRGAGLSLRPARAPSAYRGGRSPLQLRRGRRRARALMGRLPAGGAPAPRALGGADPSTAPRGGPLGPKGPVAAKSRPGGAPLE